MSDWESISALDGSRGLICLPLARSGLSHLFTLRGEEAPGRRPGPGIPETLLLLAGLGGIGIAMPVQVHGARIAVPGPSGRTTEPERADGVVVHARRGGAAVATADCVG